MNDLMRTTDQVQLVSIQEFRDHINAEGEANATIVFAPALDILVGIAPEQVAEQPSIGHICGSHQATNLLHALQIGTEAAVAAKDLLVYDRSHRQTIETVCERFP